MIDIQYPRERYLVVWSESLGEFYVLAEDQVSPDDVPLTELSEDYFLLKEFKKACEIANQYCDVVGRFSRLVSDDKKE